MNTAQLTQLLAAYRSAPREYQATQYWAAYENQILETIRTLDIAELRSGKYPVLDSFGFNDVTYDYYRGLSFWKKAFLAFLQEHVIKGRAVLPYNLSLGQLRELAYRHCELLGQVCDAPPIGTIEVSTFGRPQDLFEIGGRKYTLPFLSFYVRHCFAHRSIRFKGTEIIVELGSGSGYQVEVLKKLHPKLTILCFDLPTQIFLCQEYLSQVLSEPAKSTRGGGGGGVVGTETTLAWKDLNALRPGAVHFFGNWQIPLLRELSFDVFWNAASFGEMEPDVVENYLREIKGRATWVYLLQARHGKETSGRGHRVKQPIVFDDYCRMLAGYSLQEEHDAWHAHRRLAQSGGYFEAVWKRAS